SETHVPDLPEAKAGFGHQAEIRAYLGHSLKQIRRGGRAPQSTKSQPPSTKEEPNFKLQVALLTHLGAWILELPWSLEFGIWSFRSAITLMAERSEIG